MIYLIQLGEKSNSVKLVFTTPNGSWEVEPTNIFAGILLAAVIAHLLFRVLLWGRALYYVYSDAPTSWIFLPWRSKWRPDTIPLNKPTFHCIVAGLLLVAYVSIGHYFGWIRLIEQK